VGATEVAPFSFGHHPRMSMTTLADLRRYAVARTLFAPTTLPAAIRKLGWVQADPIRAPARAQDLTLRHRVDGYIAGDLERRYPRLQLEEDFFVNYGFLPRAHQALMHPRRVPKAWSAATKKRAQALLEFVRERRLVHPRDVDAFFAHGQVKNYWGGSSSATTHLLDAMHYRGLLRVVRRDNGIRLYAAHEHAPFDDAPAARRERLDALADLIVRAYAPLPATTLSGLIARLRHGTPQWHGELRATVARARERLAHERVDGIDWYWPAGDRPSRHAPDDTVRLLAPFDPIVWDRRRFELFWDWAYRFEAYTPPAKRKLGYYALPLVWRDAVIGWGNVGVKDGRLVHDIGYVAGRAPNDAVFRRELEAEIDRLRVFLDL